MDIALLLPSILQCAYFCIPSFPLLMPYHPIPNEPNTPPITGHGPCAGMLRQVVNCKRRDTINHTLRQPLSAIAAATAYFIQEASLLLGLPQY
jgi:hypothetical protein